MSPNGQLSSESNARRFTDNDIVELTKKCYPSVDIRISNFKIEPFSKETLGFVGVYDLLTVDVNVQDKLESRTFFVKAMSPFANDFQKMICHEEYKFFDEVIPRLLESYNGKPWAPLCFMAKDSVLVLEDLRAQGYKITNKLSDDQLMAAMTSIARFHASSMLLQDKLKQPFDQIYPGYFTEKMFLKDDGTNWQFLLTGVEVAEAVAQNLGLDPKYTLSAYEWLVDEIKPKAEERNVLCHCDLWCNNVMFDESGNNCRLVDFQQAVYTSYIVDLVQFIHLNITRDRRRKLETDLLELYHSELSKNLRNHGYSGKMISLKEMMRDIEKKRVIGLVTATQTLPLALLNKELSKEFTKDDEHFKMYMFQSRKDFVMNAMRQDAHYRTRIEEAVGDLVNYMDKFISVER